MDSQEVIHKRVLDTKWRSLAARGYNPPKDVQEAAQRLIEALRQPRAQTPEEAHG